MTAVEGGSVVCFALRVVGALQYLCSRGRHINLSAILFLLGGGGQPAREILAESAVFGPGVCGRKKVWRSQVRGDTTKIRDGVGRT